MRGRICCLFLLLLIGFSCTNRQQVPSGIIGTDSMKLIMRDLVIADQFVTQFLVKDSLSRDVKKESQEWYEKMFAVHGTTRQEFRKSLDYYSTRPDLEKIIFDSLSDNVTKERALMYKNKYGARDSLAKRRADSAVKRTAGPPPLNPDSLKRVILLAHPGLPIAILLDSVHQRMKIRATQDSLRNVIHVRDSTRKQAADSVRMKRTADSIRRGRPRLPGTPGGPLRPGPFLPKRRPAASQNIPR